MNEKSYQKAINARRRAFERYKAKHTLKEKSTLQSALNRVYEEARKDTWSTSHKNCFRGSISIDGKAETEAHLDKKYELWKEYRKAGATVFTELRLLDGSRPDLVVCWNNGEVEIVEVAHSEKEESILLKEDKYPFPMKVVKV
jgi:hypothetical protein